MTNKNAKFEIIKAFFSLPLHEHVTRVLSKCTVLKVGLLQDHQIHSLEACALFSPEILQAVAVKGLTYSEHNEQQQTVPIQSNPPRQHPKHFVVIGGLRKSKGLHSVSAYGPGAVYACGCSAE